MDLQKLLEMLESRQEAYRKTWVRLSKPSKIIIVGLIVIGLINIMIGSVLICSGG
jgi:type II secretory pathway component PulF